MNRLRVAVLMGGASTEREISFSTGRQILAALDRSKYTVTAVDPAALSPSDPAAFQPTKQSTGDLVVSSPPPPAELISLSYEQWSDRNARPDVVFIALHGKGGEDGTIQGLMELLGLPYTGSGVLASALAMDKARTKRLLRSEGIAVPDDIALRPHDSRIEAARRVAESFGYPVIVKPNAQGSTIGCHIVRSEDGLQPAIEDAFKYDSTVLLEQFVEGIEITAGVLGNNEPKVLPLIEIATTSGFYDYEAKYAPGASEHIIPARISERAAALARDYAARSHLLLGCRGMSRTDMIVVGDQPYVLEVNTIPGMTPTSLLPDAARAAGIEFPELLDRLIGYAFE